MKFLTRELFNDRSSNKMEKWDEAEKKCQEYYNSIKGSLPESMKDYWEHGPNPHDGIIKSVSKDKDRLIITIDGSTCPSFDDLPPKIKDFRPCPKGLFQIIFSGLKSAKGINDIVNDEWLYDEVHLSESGKFEYHVLLEKSEIVIVANNIEINEIK